MTAEDLVRANIRALIGEIDDARVRLRQLADEIAATDPGEGEAEPSRPALALLAVDLHSYYTVLEGVIERIVAALEGQSPGGAESHAALLRHALREVDGVRPAILDPSHEDGVQELRRFRHAFRHAYALDLRFDKLRRALDPMRTVGSQVDGDLARFAAFLHSILAEVESPTRE